jgi:hypothetical protein
MILIIEIMKSGGEGMWEGVVDIIPALSAGTASVSPYQTRRGIKLNLNPWSESASELYRPPLVGEVIANFCG